MKFTLNKTIKCSHCNNELNFIAYPLIILQDLTEDEFKKFFELELFKIKCDKCDKTTIVQYDTIVVDMYKKYLLFLCSSNDTKLLEKNEVIKNIIKKESNGEELYNSLTTFRVVTNLNDMLDKLLIFDYDLDDRVIECVKYQIITNMIKNTELTYNDYKIYFNKLEKTDLLFTVIPKNESPLLLSIPISSYNFFIEHTNINDIEKTKEFININNDWILKNIKMKVEVKND